MKVYIFAVLLLLIQSSFTLTDYSHNIHTYLTSLQKDVNRQNELEDLFDTLDVNSDGVIDHADMNSLKLNGIVSYKGSQVIGLADLSNKGYITKSEFTLLPVLIEILEDKYADKTPNVIAIDTHTKHQLMKASNSYSSLLEIKEKKGFLNVRASAKLKLGPLSLGVSIGSKKKKKKPPKCVGEECLLPQSIFGIPDYYSESCVLCQYFTQKILHNIGTISPSYLSGDDSQSADDSASTVGQYQAPKTSQTDSVTAITPGGQNALRKLIKASKGRVSAERMIENFFDSTMSDICMYIPHVMKEHCKRFRHPTNRNVVIQSLYQGDPPALICEYTFFCKAGSYSSTAVHMPMFSSKLNEAPKKSGLQFCGFLGGPHERPGVPSRKVKIDKKICGF